MRVVVLTLILSLPSLVAAAECRWPAWEDYKKAMLSADGRVIDRSSKQQITTSEGQSYGMFFALLGNDRDSFARLLDWTRTNLTDGDLNHRLPAWQWGLGPDGHGQILDTNNASDADLWMAYSLLEAGRLWQRPDYQTLGLNMLWRSTAQTVRNLPGLGLMLLPGDVGFESADGWRLNPSYLPPQLLARFALVTPIWADVAKNAQSLLLETSPKGLAPNWVMWKTGQGWAVEGKDSIGSYDAIRVYLWLGMLSPDAPGRAQLVEHFKPMLALTMQLGYPPERVDSATGSAEGIGPIGFSASLLPLLASTPLATEALAVQRQRLRQNPPLPNAYYNQSLLLFGQGWDQQRYRFDKHGRLLPAWASVCTK